MPIDLIRINRSESLTESTFREVVQRVFYGETVVKRVCLSMCLVHISHSGQNPLSRFVLNLSPLSRVISITQKIPEYYVT